MLVDGLGSFSPLVVLFTPLNDWVCGTHGGCMTGPPGMPGAGGPEVAGGGTVAPHVVGTASRTSLDDALAAIFSARKTRPQNEIRCLHCVLVYK